MHTQTQARTVLLNYYFIAPRNIRTHQERLTWAAEQFARTHAPFSRARAYNIIEEATR